MLHLLDKQLTQGFFAPLAVRRASRATARTIPILMYHSVSDTPETQAHPYFWVNTAPARFEVQMRFLKETGYSVISLSRAVEHLFNARIETEWPARCVVITFDDGFKDFHLNAYPVLEKYGFTATVFLPTDCIGNPARQMDGKAHLSWREVVALHQAGISFGSHTASHPQLKLLRWEKVEDEIRRSREIIESNIGAPIDAFSYPFAFPEEDRKWTQRLAESLGACGYTHGVSTRIGRATARDPVFFLKRLPVNSRDDLTFFKAKLDGGYDWLHGVQLTSKKIRAKVRNAGKRN